MNVDGAGISEHLVVVHVEVADHHFVARHGLIGVVVGEKPDGVIRVPAVVGAQEEIDGHALPGSRWGVEERKVIDVMAGFMGALVPFFIRNSVGLVGLLAIGLAGAYG